MPNKLSSITIRDVARLADVSVATVSRYINKTAPVSTEVSNRIQQIMDDLQYVPHSVARSLATHKTNTLGLVLSNMHNDFFGPLLSGIEDVVSHNAKNLLVATYRPNLRKEIPPPIGPHNTDGLLVFADSLSDDHILNFYKIKFPLVLIHRTPPASLPIPCVTVENKAATRKLISHLIEVHGKRRILCLLGPIDQEDTRWREMGYKAALEEHHIPFDPALILPGEFENQVAYQTMRAFLAQEHPEFDAVFAGDDDAAVGVLEALREAGKRVPQDIAVVGFDDQRMSPFLQPPLTTVRAPTHEVGRTAAQQLINVLRGKPARRITLLPTELVVRHSCGC